MLHPELHVHAACILESSAMCGLLTVDEAVDAVRLAKRTVWINIYGADDQAARVLLEDRLGYHELAVEDALSDAERPTVQEYDETLFFVIPAVMPNGEDDRFVELAIFLTDKAIVTFAKERIEEVHGLFERWQQRPARLSATGPARLAHILVDSLVDRYFPVADAIEDEVDDIGERLFDGDVHQVQRIQTLKRRLLNIRRQLAPTRDVLNSLLRRDLDIIPRELDPYFQDVLDHVLRLGEMIDMNRETLASLLDVHLSTISNNTNEVMKRMTYYATALMTSSLVAGIYGMNFEHMPELKWAFGYPFALGLMVAAFLGVRYLFKRKGWL